MVQTKIASALEKFNKAIKNSASLNSFYNFAKCKEEDVEMADGTATICNRADVGLFIDHVGYDEEGNDLYEINFIDAEEGEDLNEEAFKFLDIPEGTGLDENTLIGTLRSIKLPEDVINEMLDRVNIYAERNKRKKAKEDAIKEKKEVNLKSLKELNDFAKTASPQEVYEAWQLVKEKMGDDVWDEKTGNVLFSKTVCEKLNQYSEDEARKRGNTIIKEEDYKRLADAIRKGFDNTIEFMKKDKVWSKVFKSDFEEGRIEYDSPVGVANLIDECAEIMEDYPNSESFGYCHPEAKMMRLYGDGAFIQQLGSSIIQSALSDVDWFQ